MAGATLIHATKKAIAEQLGVSERTVGEILKSGELPIVRLGARKIGVADQDLRNWIAKRREPAQIGAAKRRPKQKAVPETAATTAA